MIYVGDNRISSMAKPESFNFVNIGNSYFRMGYFLILYFLIEHSFIMYGQNEKYQIHMVIAKKLVLSSITFTLALKVKVRPFTFKIIFWRHNESKK